MSAQLSMKGLAAALLFVFGGTVSAATILSNGTAPGDNFTNALGSNTGHPSSTLFACQTHNRGISRNENKELARSQKFVVVTRLA